MAWRCGVVQLVRHLPGDFWLFLHDSTAYPVIASRMRRLLEKSALLMAISSLWAQTAERSKFEVAAIKPSRPGLQGMLYRGLGTNHFTATNVSTRELIIMAYHLFNHQVTGGPNWIDSERYDISAKAPDVSDLKQMEELVQSLLEDRFQLKFHRETKEMPMFELAAGKKAPKLGDPVAGLRDSAYPGLVEAHNAGIGYLAFSLSYQLGRTVVNKTGIEGKFSYTLKYTPEGRRPRGDEESVSVFTAIQEQLGLQLKSIKGDVEILVVDQVERPGEN